MGVRKRSSSEGRYGGGGVESGNEPVVGVNSPPAGQSASFSSGNCLSRRTITANHTSGINDLRSFVFFFFFSFFFSIEILFFCKGWGDTGGARATRAGNQRKARDRLGSTNKESPVHGRPSRGGDGGGGVD